MIAKDSNGNLVDIVIYGDSVDNLDVLRAVYISSGFDVPDDEIDFIMNEHYYQIKDELFTDNGEEYEY
jgi:hypothetical protein